jgi:hypothetical protein
MVQGRIPFVRIWERLGHLKKKSSRYEGFSVGNLKIGHRTARMSPMVEMMDGWVARLSANRECAATNCRGRVTFREPAHASAKLQNLDHLRRSREKSTGNQDADILDGGLLEGGLVVESGDVRSADFGVCTSGPLTLLDGVLASEFVAAGDGHGGTLTLTSATAATATAMAMRSHRRWPLDGRVKAGKHMETVAAFAGGGRDE